MCVEFENDFQSCKQEPYLPQKQAYNLLTSCEGQPTC